MTDVVAGAAGEVLGPRPGKAACSFSQGIVEIVLRAVEAVSKNFTDVLHLINLLNIGTWFRSIDHRDIDSCI